MSCPSAICGVLSINSQVQKRIRADEELKNAHTLFNYDRFKVGFVYADWRCMRRFKVTYVAIFVIIKVTYYVAIFVCDDYTIFDDSPLAWDVHAWFTAHSCMNKITLNR